MNKKKPQISDEHCWQHILTKFVYEINEQSPYDCSNILIRQGQTSTDYSSSIERFLSYWPEEGDDHHHWPYDEYLSQMFHHLIRLTSSCSRTHLYENEKYQFCYLHEYLILAKQGIVRGMEDEWADLQINDDEQ